MLFVFSKIYYATFSSARAVQAESRTASWLSVPMYRRRLCSTKANAKARLPYPHPFKLRKYKSVRFCGCKVVRLQNIVYLCSSYNNQVSIMSIVYTNPQTGDGDPYLLPFYAVTQPHNHIAALQHCCAVIKPHNHINTKPHNFAVLHLCVRIFVQRVNYSCMMSHNRITVQQNNYVFVQPHY